MNYDKFIKEVKARTHIDNDEEADKTVRAVLKTLSEHLDGNEAGHIKAQLPQEISKYIVSRKDGESFSVNEFFERVADREKDRTLETAIQRSRAVIEVLCEAISEGELYDLKSQLPSEFEILFETVHK